MTNKEKLNLLIFAADVAERRGILYDGTPLEKTLIENYQAIEEMLAENERLKEALEKIVSMECDCPAAPRHMTDEQSIGDFVKISYNGDLYVKPSDILKSREGRQSFERDRAFNKISLCETIRKALEESK